MLPLHEGPEPGYIACHLMLVTQSRANAIATLSHTLSIVDGYVVEATTTARALVNSAARSTALLVLISFVNRAGSWRCRLELSSRLEVEDDDLRMCLCV